jgi:hypothetical protein
MNASSLTAALGLGALGFAAYALGYLAHARHVETAAEARKRRQVARDEQTFKRWCKRHAEGVRALADFDGNRDMSFPGGVLHMSAPEETIRLSAKNAKGWLELWADEATYPHRSMKTGHGVARRGKYLRPNQPAQYGSSKRGKVERPWANGFNAYLLGVPLAPKWGVWDKSVGGWCESLTLDLDGTEAEARRWVDEHEAWRKTQEHTRHELPIRYEARERTEKPK